MYEFKKGTAITASLGIQIQGVPSLLTGVPLTVAGDQRPPTSKSEVVATWKVGDRNLTVLVPVQRIDNFSSFWVVPDAVA